MSFRCLALIVSYVSSVDFACCQHPMDKMRYKSKVITNNGLNPVWDQTFEFRIEHPELAMLHIGVYHQV